MTNSKDNKDRKFGFTRFTEIWHGRLVMVAFVIFIAIKLLTGEGFLSPLGLM